MRARLAIFTPISSILFVFLYPLPSLYPPSLADCSLASGAYSAHAGVGSEEEWNTGTAVGVRILSKHTLFNLPLWLAFLQPAFDDSSDEAGR